MARVREFNPAALDANVNPRLQLDWRPKSFFENRAWKLVIFLPRWFITDLGKEPVCIARDERLLEELLLRDFGGYSSSLSPVRGIGRRGAQFDMNIHAQSIVLASRWRGTRRYFQTLRRE